MTALDTYLAEVTRLPDDASLTLDLVRLLRDGHAPSSRTDGVRSASFVAVPVSEQTCPNDRTVLDESGFCGLCGHQSRREQPRD